MLPTPRSAGRSARSPWIRRRPPRPGIWRCQALKFDTVFISGSQLPAHDSASHYGAGVDLYSIRRPDGCEARKEGARRRITDDDDRLIRDTKWIQ